MKILLVTGRYPWPPWTGDRLRAHQWITLTPSSIDVSVLSPEPTASDPPPPSGVRLHTFAPSSKPGRAARAARAAITGRSAQAGLFQEPKLREALARLGPEHDAVVLLLARLEGHVDDVGDRPLIVDLIDALSLNFASRARRDRWWLRPVWRLESRMLRRTERRLVARAATATVVCQRDREYLDETVQTEGRVEVLPIAVAEDRLVAPAENRANRIVFSGNLGYFVNRDAATWFLRQVWPAVRARRPATELHLVGDRPPRALERLANARGARIVARPDDVRASLRAAAVSVAPLRCGAGLPIKILEAWATSTPVVASSHAAAGVGARPGEDLVVADEPHEWVDSLASILETGDPVERIVAGGLARLRRDYSPESVRTRLSERLSDWLA